MCRNNKDWLKYQVENEIKLYHKLLYVSKWKQFWSSFITFSTGRNSWWFIILIILFVVSLGLLNFECFNWIKLDLLSSKTIIDQRISNIAAIISITLVVVGFLINNLAVKESYAYHLLFKKSLLYPILYITLTVIGFFAFVSAMRDTFGEYYFSRLALIGTYMALFILFLIGFLFRRIIYFTDSKHIEAILEEELLKESRSSMRYIVEKRISRKLFIDLLKKKGAEEYDPFYNFKFEYSVSEVLQEEKPIDIPKRPKILNINMKNISEFITEKSNGGTMHFHPLELYMESENYRKYIWFDDSTLDIGEQNKLERCLHLKFNKDKEKKNRLIYRKYFDDKLEEFSEKNKYKNLENVLNSFVQVYKIQMNNQGKNGS